MVQEIREVLQLKKSNCKNCYKCIRHCPVKSIRFSGNQAHIVSDECILCGQCFVVCPQNAKQIADDTEKLKVLLASGAPVIASVAPSFAANYPGVGIESMEEALKKLGFFAAEETAIGATFVKREYDRIVDEEQKEIVISSCCHTVNLLIRKHFPDCIRFLADVVSPMVAHCADIKKRYPDAKTVFIGPCLSKKDEAQRSKGIVDCVLTFEELSSLFEENSITPEQKRVKNGDGLARIFPTTGGILKSMKCDNPDYTYISVDGVENCISALKDIQNNELKNCFIEMSACAGSCSCGPVMEKYQPSPIHGFQEIFHYSGKKDFDVPQPSPSELHINHPYLGIKHNMPSESEIKNILLQMGKTKPEHELNCGSCGYNTCREKAIAIYQGKANITMCLPFLKDKAESFSDTIINNTPNGIFVLNEKLEVQQINNAALKLMNIKDASVVLGEPVVRILDPKIFLEVSSEKCRVKKKVVYLTEYDKYAEQTVIFDNEYRVYICIMRDITSEQNERKKKDDISRRTIAVADSVVDKQMRVVQEIASLLGETAAETKIALTKLKESINGE